MKTLSFALALCLCGSSIVAGCATDLQGPDDTSPDAATPPADNGSVTPPPADAGTPPADNGPRIVCGDGVCSDRNLDCANDCRDVPPADAGLPACQTGSARCSDGLCHSTETEVANCGACGRACAAGQVCSASACTTPVDTGGTPTSGEDVYVINYATAGGDNASAIENWIMQPLYRSCNVNRADVGRTGPLTTSTCTFRVPRSDSRAVWLNAHFTLNAIPGSQPDELSTWAAYAQSPGVPNSYSRPTGTKNGRPIGFHMVPNAMGNGYNWTPDAS